MASVVEAIGDSAVAIAAVVDAVVTVTTVVVVVVVRVVEPAVVCAEMIKPCCAQVLSCRGCRY